MTSKIGVRNSLEIIDFNSKARKVRLKKSSMKILLINNTASINAILAEAFNNIDGVEAKYVVTSQHKYLMSNKYEIYLKFIHNKKKPLLSLFYNYLTKKKFLNWIAWADVVYYLCDSILGEEDLKHAHYLGKKIFVEWVGSDIRDPDILNQINPYYKSVFNNGYEYKEIEASNFKNKVQEKFYKYKAQVCTIPELLLYTDKKFKHPYLIQQKFDVKNYTPSNNNPRKKRPLILHSPSAPMAKGSEIIKVIIEELKEKFDFDFELLHNIPRSEVLQKMKICDIFIDQIIVGSYGLASIEAMSLGKPVLCYIMPEVFSLGLPVECPIINTNPQNLKENLTSLICNEKERWEIGMRSRKYVELYHDVDNIACELLTIFSKPFPTTK